MSLYDDYSAGDTFLTIDSALDTSAVTLKEDNVVLANKLAAAEHTIDVLERNISSLYATAKLEMRRKDDEIKKLRDLADIERTNAAVQQEAIRGLLRRIKGVIDHAEVVQIKSNGYLTGDAPIQELKALLSEVPSEDCIATAELAVYRQLQAELVSRERGVPSSEPAATRSAAPITHIRQEISTHAQDRSDFHDRSDRAREHLRARSRSRSRENRRRSPSHSRDRYSRYREPDANRSHRDTDRHPSPRRRRSRSPNYYRERR